MKKKEAEVKAPSATDPKSPKKKFTRRRKTNYEKQGPIHYGAMNH